MKRQTRKQRRNRTNPLDFQSLEARQLLAGDVIGSHQVAGNLPTGANIVVNGDFETFTAGADNFFDQSEVAGWNAVDANTGQEINLMPYNVSGYDRVLDLDSTTTDFDRVYQDVDTQIETEYLVTFDYRSHPTFDANATQFTHDFEVWWNNVQVGRFTGGDFWNTGVIRVTSSNADTTRLLFCEIIEASSSTGDGQGPLLDNIRVVKANETAVTNGSFETTADDKSVFFKPGEVDAWTSVATNLSDRLIKVIADGGSQGDQYLNLDSTSENRDIVFTDLATTAGSSYYVTFDMRTDGLQTTNPDELRVRWNGEWATTIFGTNEFESYALLLTADSTETQLMFLEPGESSGDGSGPLIDNLRVFEVAQVIPGEFAIDANGSDEGVDATSQFIPGAGAQAIGKSITVSHSDEDGVVTGAEITLNGVVDGQNEIISISAASVPTDGNGDPKIIVNAYDSATRKLTLNGNATAAEYEAVLKTLTYYNAKSVVSTTSRLVDITITDATGDGNPQTAEAAIDLSIETNQQLIDDAILTKYAADNNLTTTDLGNGLYAVIDEPGSGLHPTFNSNVRVKYVGKFLEVNAQNKIVAGETFDLSSDEGFETSLSSVIAGWSSGIPAFATGGIGKLLIPSHLGYGSSGFSSIPGNTVLLFDIELLQVVS
ncbi:MAG: FKBP-type peptidyl-prolyl cis-trans isomerase FkpA [Mariniblastus sp.]|jgi:FKBP-type peptidyl-prolyl cis-trans isomerase FkpA